MEISIDNAFCDMEGEELILCDGGGILLGVGSCLRIMWLEKLLITYLSL